MSKRFASHLSKEPPKWKTFLVTLGLVIIIDSVDVLTLPNMDFTVFYLSPITYSAWFGGTYMGVFIAILSATTWVISEYINGQPLSQSGIILAWDSLTHIIFFCLFAILVSSLRNNLIKEKALARTDMVTGAANNRQFTEVLRQEILRFQRYEKPFTLVYIDLDNFKTVNDTHGHQVGDEVLKSVANCAKTYLRNTDIIARLGGDEYALLLPETSGLAAHQVIPRLLKKLQHVMDDHGWPVTFSCGVVSCENEAKTAEDLIKQADDLMYVVKNSGKNAIRFQSI